MIPDLVVNPQDPERRLRAWGISRALSGDIITEQNIHSLDVMTWILDQHPVKALGTGGLEVPQRRRRLGPLLGDLLVPRRRARHFLFQAVWRGR